MCIIIGLFFSYVILFIPQLSSSNFTSVLYALLFLLFFYTLVQSSELRLFFFYFVCASLCVLVVYVIPQLSNSIFTSILYSLLFFSFLFFSFRLQNFDFFSTLCASLFVLVMAYFILQFPPVQFLRPFSAHCYSYFFILVHSSKPRLRISPVFRGVLAGGK